VGWPRTSCPSQVLEEKEEEDEHGNHHINQYKFKHFFFLIMGKMEHSGKQWYRDFREKVNQEKHLILHVFCCWSIVKPAWHICAWSAHAVINGVLVGSRRSGVGKFLLKITIFRFKYTFTHCSLWDDYIYFFQGNSVPTAVSTSAPRRHWVVIIFFHSVT
jgi:hypothetical protein